jgi:hypothetical protein
VSKNDHSEKGGSLMLFLLNEPFVATKENDALINHAGGVGELGYQMHITDERIVNHSVTQCGTIGDTLVNHALDDAAPSPREVMEPVSEEKLADILGLRPYAGRACSITCAGDTVQLPEELRAGWKSICAHFDHVGLKGQYASTVVWNNDFSIALEKDLKNLPLDTFYFGAQAHDVRPDAARLFITRMMNDKSNFLKLVRSTGISIAPTIFFDTKEQCDVDNVTEFPIVLKLNESVAGLGTVICRTREELAAYLKNISPGVGLHLQKYLGADAQFISAQYWLFEGRAHYVTATCNFIGGETSHEGNWGGELFDMRFPLNPDCVAGPAAQIIASMGAKGWLGIDVGVDGCGRMYPVEANLRYTAAAYYYLTAKKLGMHNMFWAGRSYNSARSLTDLDLGHIAFTPKKGCGWILTNWGPMVCGKSDGDNTTYGGGFLYLGPAENYQRAEDELQTFLA